ncbi:4-alpha-glucanotransferase [Miniimonas arenae]|uniref:4-alpha-glucanotransferase n=1 Tax=Miniimonas arenae TaxID=676201 RepID=A0A5C5BC52_9MICO|nr:4-alpha-glucanotransferase [Miniimonas arenae]TNU74088.1 4-alpha-glucanotransferase [Miniimonas arenae]
MTNDADRAAPSEQLRDLAERYGISTEYWSFFGDRVHVPAATLRAVLEAMGVATFTEEQVHTALAERDAQPWRELVPPSLVLREGAEHAVDVRVRDGHDVTLTLRLEDGTERTLELPDQEPERRDLDTGTVWGLRAPLPADLPLGWHAVHAVEHRLRGGETGGDAGGEAVREATCVVAITPQRLPEPTLRPGLGGRGWGLMAQLYSVRSRASWGIGDFADLADIARLVGERGGDFVLVNPIHAAEVAGPIEPSPYLPTSRRFVNPLYLRPEDIREAAYLPSSQRALVEWAHDSVRASNTDPARIDRDAAWSAKKAALEVVFAAPRSAGRQRAFEAYVAREGRPLADFALWCALQEHFEGTVEPEEAHDVTSPLVARLRTELAERVEFYEWLQWIADEQLAAAQASAHEAGMSVGVMHDLAVGVHPEGSDAWSLRRMYATGITVGAPPDMYNQQGQDWSQPPWRPDALAREAYAPLRDMIRSLLRHAGALRIDHIIGFFRLWWIPAGQGAGNGAYVRYDHEAMIGVLALEAHRAGAVIIGEDLGNVEPWVREYLSSRGILGTSVLWFEYEDGHPAPPEHYRRLLLATVNTHDLPPTAGYLAGEHVDLRARLGLLTEPVEHVRAEAERERDQMLGILRERGLIGEYPSEREIVEALHVHLVASDSLLIGVALVDAVGERRAQNQPGTFREYPNWQIPLADSSGHAVLVDELDDVVRFQSLTAAVDTALHRWSQERGLA